MCDCFHMVLPTWPGAPGSVSGRQLQPEPPEAETEEDHSVTEGPEVIRPRPQGSSPVYECVTEGAGSRLQEDAPRRPGSSGRRRSWWKRDSGDSRTLPRMSHLEEATEVTLETEVEAGASGYSVTGGGDQGIFVTQVLKDSSAAKLFSLREGDQLLSATIFFDGITYEDALKILQYSEPYKVQFKIRRKLPAREDKEGASGSAQHGLKGSEEQEQDVTDGGSETPTRTLVGDGDQERLISRPREGRRPQRHRLSWPKFQAIQSRRAPGPRRSRSSSEADERRAAPEVSPGSTDTEAQHLAEEREQKAGPGSQQGGRFRNFTFRVSSGKRRSPAGRPGRGTNEGTVQAGVLEEAELPPEPGQHSLPGEGTLGQEAASAPRQTKTDKELEETAGQAKEGVGLAPGEGREGLQGLEGGIARLALRDTADLGARRSQPTELRVQTPTLTTPKFGIAKEKAQETEEGTRALPTGPGRARGPEDTEARREDVRKVDAQETHRQVGQLPLEAGGGKEEDRLQQRQGDGRGEAKDEEGTEGKTKLLKFKLPAFGWSPGKDHKTGEKPQREGEKKKETERQESLKMDMKTGDEEDKAKTDKREDTQGRKTTREKQEAEDIKLELSLGDKEVAARDSKFKMPKFKMPSFGVSAPGKSVEAAVEVSLPKAEADASAPSGQAAVKAGDLSAELPSAELDVKGPELGGKLPEGQLPDAELKEPAAGIALKGHLPKVQMPSIKVPRVDLRAPQVDIKGPKLDLRGAKGEVSAPDVAVSPPSVELEAQAQAQAPGGKLEADVSLGDKEVAARDSKFVVPNFNVSLFASSSTKSSVSSSPFILDGQHGESVSSSSPSDSLASSFDVHISKDPEADGPPLGPDSDLIPLKKSPFEIPQVFPSPESSSAESSAPDGSAVGPVLPRGGAPFSELSAEGSFKGAVPTRGSPLKVPWLGWPGFSSGRLDLSGTHAEAPSSPGVTLTKYRETLPSVAVLPELPLESSSGSQDARLPAAGGPASLPPLEGGAPSPAQSPAGPVDPLFPASYGRVTFPIFHRPKFAFSIPKAAKAELDPCTVARDLAQSAPSPGWGLDSAAEEAPGLLSPGSQPSRLSVSVPRSGGASEAASGEAPAEDAGREGRGGPLKTQRIQLPSFRRSPEKGAGRAAVPAVTVGAGPTGALPGVCVSPVEVLPEKEGEEGAAPSGCAGLQPTPPSLQASEGAAGLLRGDPAVSLSPAPRGEAGVGGPRTMAAPPEGAGVDPHLPQVQAPRLGSADLALRLGKAKAEVSLSAGSPPQEHRPSAGDGSQGHRPGDVAASRLQPSCGSAHAEAPVVESPEAATTAGSQGGWFRMPALRLPSVRRSAKEKGGAGASAASTARGGEVPAAVKGQGVQVPGSDVEAAVSLRPPETGADEAAAESTLYADVLRRNLDGQGLELHLPPAGVSPADLSTAQVSVRPGDGSLPLQMPGGRLSEARAPTGEMDATPPAGPAGLDLAGGAERAEERPSLPEGPVRLKASRTDRPSQVSVVDMGQPWEGSVLTVKLPRLSVPRFAFPDASSEADVFIPAVTEVSSLDDALGTESAGVWGASILKAGAGAAGGQPVALDLSPEASRISKVRVHIQGAQGEGPEVAVHRRVTAELVDLSGPAAISTQVVRESEIPASEVQRASYGFSLLKGRVPEPPTQVRGQDSWPPEGSPEAPKRAAPGADRLSGDPQPDTGEAFEVVLPGTSVSGQPAITPDVHTEPQGADSGSDEEPAEILEFPPEEDSEEAAACLAEEGRAAQEKPEGKRSSGLFRFWLPNIGFSSSVEETRADPNVDRSAPVQTQPGPRPEAEPPKKQEKGGWFRFPKLGFSSTPTKKSKSSEDTVTPAEQKSQEEAVTFFDARESFSPEDKEEGEVAEAMGTGQGTGAMVTSAARTELILLEQDPDTGDEPAPGPASQGGQT